ncbi:unnamed protein product [Amaranthus hypochondriacus]
MPTSSWKKRSAKPSSQSMVTIIPIWKLRFLSKCYFAQRECATEAGVMTLLTFEVVAAGSVTSFVVIRVEVMMNEVNVIAGAELASQVLELPHYLITASAPDHR